MISSGLAGKISRDNRIWAELKIIEEKILLAAHYKKREITHTVKNISLRSYILLCSAIRKDGYYVIDHINKHIDLWYEDLISEKVKICWSVDD